MRAPSLSQLHWASWRLQADSGIPFCARSPLDPFRDRDEDGTRRLVPAPSPSPGSEGSASSRWSFLDTHSPDLTLSVEGDTARTSDDVSSLYHLDGAASEDAASIGEGGPVEQGEVLEATRLSRVQSVGLLVPAETLRASTSTAPDSFVDPHMSHPTSAHSPPPRSTSPRPPARTPSVARTPSLDARATSVAWPSVEGGSPRFDVAGRPAPCAPPPADPFTHALYGQGNRLSVLAYPLRQDLPDVDNTTSSFNSIAASAAGYLDTTMPFEASPRLRPSSAESGTSLALLGPGARPCAPLPASRGTSPAWPGRPLSEHLVVDFPTVPPRSYSPDVLRPRSAEPGDAAWSSPPLADLSPPRPPLALRRSAQHLPPLLPTSHAASRHLSIPSSMAHTPSSPDSPATSSLPFIMRSDDGFYRLPVTPSTPSTRRTRRERQETSDLAFPLPPVPDSATMLLERAAADSPWSALHHASSMGGPTPSPTYSLPTSPPPNSPPPPLPDFVSVFLDPPAGVASSSASSDDDSDFAGPVAPTHYPPAPPDDPLRSTRHSHARAMESVSSSVAAPLRHSLRQRVVSSAGGEQATPARLDGVSETSESTGRDRMEAWLRGLAPDRPPTSAPEHSSSAETKSSGGGSPKVRWADKAAPGWSLRSDPARWGGERTREAGGGIMSRLGAALRSKKVRIVVGVAVVAALLLVVGLAAGLTRRAASVAAPAACTCEHGGSVRASSDGMCYCSCSAGWGGTNCHLNATCVDVGGGPVAQGLLDLVDVATELWQPVLDASGLGSLLADYFVAPAATTSSSCQSQLSLLALPSLPSSTFPSRLRWAEAALVHTLALTESNSTLTQLRTFASGLSFGRFGDSPASKPNSNFQIIAGGWTWDFSVMQRSATGSWASVVKPSSDSVARLGAAPLAQAALDRLAPIAAAASTQRLKALEHFWTGTLGRTSDELAAFRTAVHSAEIVIPLDATASVGGTSMMDLAQAQSDAESYPPAIGCWAGLSEAVVERVNSVEVSAFGLDAVSSSQAIDATCLVRSFPGALAQTCLTRILDRIARCTASSTSSSFGPPSFRPTSARRCRSSRSCSISTP